MFFISEHTSLGCRESAKYTRIGGPDACEVYPHTQPWMVGLYIGRKPQKIKCGGSLIGRKVVLTAAHCICTYRKIKYRASECNSSKIWEKMNLKYISLGDHDEKKFDPGEQKIKVAEFIVHESYYGNN